MRRTFLIVLPAVFLVGLAGCGGESKEADLPGAKPQADAGQGDVATQPEGAGAGTLDVSCVTPDFFAAVVVHPQEILRSPGAEGLPLKEPLALLQKSTGVDSRRVEQLVMLFEMPPAAGASRGMPRPTAILRFGEPVDVEKLVEKLVKKLVKPTGASVQTVREGDLVYYRHGPRGDLAACAAGDRTVVISHEAMLKKIIARTGGNTPLADRLRAADGGADLLAVLVVEPVRQMIEQAAAGAKDEIPEELAPFAAMAEHLEAATLTADLSGDPIVRLVLEATGTESAGKLEEMAQGLVAMAGIFYTSRREEMLQQEPREASKAVVELADEVLRGIKVVKKADRVVVTIKRPKGMDTLGKTLAPAIAAGRDKIDRARERALSSAARAQISALANALEAYRLDLNAYPTTEQGLQSLRNPPADSDRRSRWNGPYLDLAKPVPPDPWGRPYQYRSPGKHNPEEFDLWSQGPDAGSAADDIGNWKPSPPPRAAGFIPAPGDARGQAPRLAGSASRA